MKSLKWEPAYPDACGGNARDAWETGVESVRMAAALRMTLRIVGVRFHKGAQASTVADIAFALALDPYEARCLLATGAEHGWLREVAE